MWELNCKESWVLKNWCFWTVVLEKTLESPLDCKEIKPVHPKGNQSWVFIGRTDVETETPKSLTTWCEELTHWKRPWCWERLKVGEEGDDRGWDGWMATLTQWTWVWVNSRSDGHRSLVYCSPWCHKELDTTELLNWTADLFHSGQQALGSSTSLEVTQMCSFLWLCCMPLYLHTPLYHSFVIHSSVDGHLGCFHILATVNSATMNTEVHVSFSVLVSSGHMPRSVFAGSIWWFYS